MAVDTTGATSATVEAARIAADATIQAAQIAADASKINTLISATGTLVALLGTVFAAYVAYKNVREPLRRADLDRQNQRAVLVAQLHTSVKTTISDVERVLATYIGDFRKPVVLSVLTAPAALEQREPGELALLGPAVGEAIVLAGLRLNDYRRAKAPIQDRLQPVGGRAATMTEKPDDFEPVVAAATAYRTALNRLESLLANDRLAHKS
jgi:hypothetical protein